MTLLSDQRYRHLLGLRFSDPERIFAAAEERRQRAPVGPDDRLLIVAIDHPARRVFRVGSDQRAMYDRRELLERTVVALRRPGVDGLLATPDIVEDLLLLEELNDKWVIGSMNRSGLSGSAWELDDRFTAYDATTIERMRLDGGKMLLRLDYTDLATNHTIEACAAAVSELAARRLVAILEPLPVHRDARGKVEVSAETDDLVEAIGVSSALGPTSAYTWLKLPAPADPERVLAATTLPCLLLGGDPGERGEELVAAWKRAMAISNVRGLVAGRSLLYPATGDVARWVDEAAKIVHGG